MAASAKGAVVMLGAELRAGFLDFFRQRGHEIVASAPIVPRDDPTLMFTNAGMVRFKDVFLGLAEPVHPRVADSQKCLRISGKHNDLEEVGRDTYHHTLFEMLGNWSFGDYYKAEAIEWAWELLTGVWEMPKSDLYATVYTTDEEAAGLWTRVTDIEASRVLVFDEKDNFWEMGETGPCGPCSEIHIDRGPGACDMKKVKGHRCAVNGGCARFIEIWNLVFIQYTRDGEGVLHELPAKHVDTGMGLERVAAILEGVDNNYDGSLLRGAIARAEEISGRAYGGGGEEDVAFRVLADHGRAVAFMIADGIDPANEGRGYVLRRLLRRAARHGKGLGLDEPFLFKVCESVIESMSAAYPELGREHDRIVATVRGEEERFSETLDRGLLKLDEAVAALGRKKTSLPGDVAFRLYDTYGFPLDMTEDILRSRGIGVDREGFDRALAEQRELARASRDPRESAVDPVLLIRAVGEAGGSSFAGADVDEAESRVVALAAAGSLVERIEEGMEAELVTALTPFYGESGGQVGDTGAIETTAGARLQVVDTRKAAPDITVHLVKVVVGAVALGDEVCLAIDADRRRDIRLNHSATHLLHAALRSQLGEGVKQAGSLVEGGRLRFDFNHEGPVDGERLTAVEDEVNEAVRSNFEVSTEEMAYADAIAAGAKALFGEKYGDVVRVVRMGDYSVELCGGTHVGRTGDIGLLRLVDESAVAAGIRRVEAVTGRGALEAVRRRDRLLSTVARLLGSSDEEAAGRVERLLEELSELESKAASAEEARSGSVVAELVSQAREVDGSRAVIARLDGMEGKAMRSLSDKVRERLGSGVVVLVGEAGSGVALTVAVTDDRTSRWDAGKIIKDLVPFIDGRGGGKADFAQGGGKDPSRIATVLEKANELIV